MKNSFSNESLKITCKTPKRPWNLEFIEEDQGVYLWSIRSINQLSISSSLITQIVYLLYDLSELFN